MSDYVSTFYGTPLGKRYREGILPIIAGYCAVPDRKRTIEMSKVLFETYKKSI